jgi:hypothetical protein
MASPLLVAIALALPVPVAWCLSQRSKGWLFSPASGTVTNSMMRMRVEKTKDAFLENLMFWLFIVFPSSSFSSLETFICTKISDQTYLVADFAEPCPWDYPDGFWDLHRWSPLATTSAAYFFIYVIGTPVTMLIVMLYHRVPAISSRKIGEATVAAMIQSYMESTSTASSSRLASFLGQASSDRELRRRIQQLYLEWFPNHAGCHTGCTGHQLPLVPLKIIQELGHPSDMQKLTTAVKKWFSKLDVSRSGLVAREELLEELIRIGLGNSSAQHALSYLGQLSCFDLESFTSLVMHELNTALPNLSALEFVTLGRLCSKHAAHANGILRLDAFEKIARELVRTSFVFTGDASGSLSRCPFPPPPSLSCGSDVHSDRPDPSCSLPVPLQVLKACTV